MKPGSDTIWIDVTTLMRWDRPIVGVVRVEEQLTRWILDQERHSIRFCRYDKGSGVFLDVARDVVAARIRFFEHLEGWIAVKPGGGVPARAVTGPAVAVAQGREQPKKARTSWSKIRRKVKKLFRRAFGNAAPAGNSPQAQPAAATQNEIVNLPRSEFGEGDVYVSVGSDWDDKDPRRLYQIKQALGLKVVGICYDAIPIKFPHLTMKRTAETFPRYLTDLAWVCDHVMCISKCTQRDFLEFAESVGARLPETSVITLGSDLLKDRRDLAAGTGATGIAAEIARTPFVLFVSTIERRKNHELLYKVWVRLIEAGCRVPDLVLVGMHGWGVDDLLADIHRDPRVKGRIHILHGIPDSELRFLFERCEYTVYPSLYEGWGLPVVESFAFKKFCLCSNAGSLTEAGENLAEYLDPWDVTAWTDRIRYFSEHPEEIEARNRRVAASFRPHQWRQTSSSILQKAQALRRPGAADRVDEQSVPAR